MRILTKAKYAFGLSAPQIGLSIQMFVTNIPGAPEYVCNPSLSVLNNIYEGAFEGCLSEPHLEVKIPRYRDISISYMDEFGARKESILTGLPARVIQNEFDHLRGVLISDYITQDVQFISCLT